MLDTKAFAVHQAASQIFLHAQQTKLMIWGELTREACEQKDGRLALRADGTGTWSCVTTSRNMQSGDVWHASFTVTDRCGVALFGAGPFYSPLISLRSSSQACSWSASFTFPAELFSAIHAAVQHCGCLPPAHALRQATPAVRATGGWHRSEIGSLLEAACA